MDCAVCGFEVSEGKFFEFAEKFQGKNPLPPRPEIKEILWSFAGVFQGIALVAILTTNLNMHLLLAPLGATAVLIFGLYDAPVSQPRNVILGYLICAVGGVAMCNVLGNSWFPLALGLGLSIATMQITRTVHPPAGAVYLIAVSQGEGMRFVLTLVGGVIVMVLTALIVNNLSRQRSYPRFW